MKLSLNALIFGLAIVIAAALLGNAYLQRGKSNGHISVTGLGTKDFSSDLIVWEGSFAAVNRNLQEAYTQVAKNKNEVENYLREKGVNSESLVFSAVQTMKLTKPKYSSNGNYAGEDFTGYELRQRVQIESKDVEKIEKISREVTELLNKGVSFYSEPPRYYYTKLADLKIEMISMATEDARLRAEKIAENSGGKLSDLRSAKMGVFQITGQNSKENYSWGGTFNTSSKEKTASITMKLIYDVD